MRRLVDVLTAVGYFSIYVAVTLVSFFIWSLQGKRP